MFSEKEKDCNTVKDEKKEEPKLTTDSWCVIYSSYIDTYYRMTKEEKDGPKRFLCAKFPTEEEARKFAEKHLSDYSPCYIFKMNMGYSIKKHTQILTSTTISDLFGL